MNAMPTAIEEDLTTIQKGFVFGEGKALLAMIDGIEGVAFTSYGTKIVEETHEHFLIGVINPSVAKSVVDLVQRCNQHDGILTRKVVVCPGTHELHPSLSLLLAELRVECIAYGKDAREVLRAFLSDTSAQASMVGTLAGYKAELWQARSQGDSELLRRLIKRIGEVIADSDDRTFTLAQAHTWVKEPRQAINLLRRFLAVKPAALWAAKDLAALYGQHHCADYALELYERLGTYQRLNPERFYQLGVLYQRCGRLQEAVLAYEHGYKLTEGGDRRFMSALMAVYAGLGRYDEALAIVDGHELAANDVSVLREQALMAAGRQDHKLSVKLLRRCLPALVQDPQQAARVAYNLTVALLTSGQADEAKAFMQDFLKGHQSPGDVGPLRELATCLQQGKAGSPDGVAGLLKQFKLLA